jgi:hypothetical protein
MEGCASPERDREAPHDVTEFETPPVFLPDVWGLMSSRRIVVDVIFGLTMGRGINSQNAKTLHYGLQLHLLHFLGFPASVLVECLILKTAYTLILHPPCIPLSST